MLLVLADDFSGAAEIAGIGHRYGLNTEIQLKPDFNTHADLIVLDTNTRSSSADQASKKISEIGALIKRWNRPIHLFKKIDSVMRGHLIAEINALQDCFVFNRIFLLPANPGRGRKILEGRYFVDGIPLDKTAFAHDPDFPVLSSAIASRIISPALTHVHANPDEILPSRALITGDVMSRDDLKKYAAASTDDDLCCGAAELFECYLERLGYHATRERSIAEGGAAFTLIMNGTTVKNSLEKEMYDGLNIPHLPLPGSFHESKFQVQEKEIYEWQQKVLSTLQSRRIAVVTIDHPVQHNKITSQLFLNYFAQLMTHITSNIDMNKIHFCLTGGATASFVMAQYGYSKWYVHEEVVPGVVSLAAGTDKVSGSLFTIKPGSYPWPESFMTNLQPSTEK